MAEETSTESPAEINAGSPDEIQSYVVKVKENIKLELEDPGIDAFLRANIKTFREEWDSWSESAKSTYTHMMTAQLLHRKAAATQIAIGNEFKLPIYSAHGTLMDSIKRALTKPIKRQPALLALPKFKATSSQT